MISIKDHDDELGIIHSIHSVPMSCLSFSSKSLISSLLTVFNDSDLCQGIQGYMTLSSSRNVHKRQKFRFSYRQEMDMGSDFVLLVNHWGNQVDGITRDILKIRVIGRSGLLKWIYKQQQIIFPAGVGWKGNTNCFWKGQNLHIYAQELFRIPMTFLNL